MKVEIPTSCPSCGSLLERVKDQLFCRNTLCESKQIKQVVNYAKVMKIKGLGEKTVERLNLSTISDIYSLSLSDAIASIGDKLAAKLFGEIENSKTAELSNFLAACSIPLVGPTIGIKLAKVINHPLEITAETCKKAGIGDKATSNLLNWLEITYKTELMNLPISFKEIEPTKVESNTTVCITGKVPGYTKATLAEYLKTYQVSVVDNLTKKVQYLICEDNKGSAKEIKATELGIPILTLENLIKEINK